MNPEVWNWAVWTSVVLIGIRAVLAPLVHGEERDRHNGFTHIFGAASTFMLLYFGGFFQ